MKMNIKDMNKQRELLKEKLNKRALQHLCWVSTLAENEGSLIFLTGEPIISLIFRQHCFCLVCQLLRSISTCTVNVCTIII